MMNRFFLFSLTILVAMSLWATTPLDHITGATVYMENIRCNGQRLIFNDIFQPTQTLNRLYQVSAFEKTDQTAIFNVVGGFDYGIPYADDYSKPGKSTYITRADDRFYFNSNGGEVVADISSIIDQARDLEVETIHFVISGQYQDNLGAWHAYEGKDQAGISLNTYFDYVLSVINASFLKDDYDVEESDSEISIKFKVKASGSANYTLQRNIEQGLQDWFTVKTGNVSTVDAKAGTEQIVTLSLNEAKSKNFELRLIAKTVKTGKADTAYAEVGCKYKYTSPNGNTEYLYPGTQRYVNIPSDCRIYNYICTKPVSIAKHSGGQVYVITMPSADLTIEEVTAKYTVRFLNADYTVLKTEEVECGADATAPADPTMEGVVFDKWSADFTNVHRNLNVYARYTMDGNYVFETSQSEHRNHVHPMDGFTQSTTRAMCGDTIVFQASVRTPQVATLRYETCYQNQDGTWTQWNAPTDNTVGSYSADDVTDGQTKEFSIAIPVAYQSNQVRQRSYGFAFRFYVTCAGSSIYSEPFEYDVYYPITIQSKIGIADGLTESLFVENSDRDFNMGELVTLPVRYEDTVRLYRLNGGTGACMNYTPAVRGGVDKEGIAYFICPGDVETVQVDVDKTAVVFEVTGQGKAEYKSYGNNAYYVEQVSCGGSVQHMPADPEEANAIFKGWKSWNASDYPDDAYLNVPTGQTMIGFTADFEYIPPVPQYTVKFFGKDSASQIGTDQTVNEGENATPPEAPEISGFHFVGWNKPYTTITANTEIVALYGEDNKKWGVTYKNWDNSDLGTDSVYDGEAAQGVIALRDGYSFTGWVDAVSGKAADLSHIMADRTVKATFEEAIYVITYAYRANPEFPLIEIAKENVRHGTMPELWSTIEPVIRAEFEAELGGWQYEIGSIQWTPTIVAATKDATYELFYSVSLRKFTVRFQNWDHSEIETQQVEYGKAAVAPTKRPRRAGYTFIGWDREFDNVIAHMIVTAQFKLGEDPNPETYKVTLIAEHGSINVVESGMDLNAVEANTVLHFTATPDEGYTFKEWKGYNAETGLTVTADTTVEAIFEPVASGMEEVLPPNKSQVRKEIVDGVLYIILPNERRFSTDGQER